MKKEEVMSYTKGEWEVNIWEGKVFDNQVEISCPEQHIRVAVIPYIDDVSKANAKLIAAAPDLLEALQEVVRISDRNHVAWDKAKAAINKALSGTTIDATTIKAEI